MDRPRTNPSRVNPDSAASPTAKLDGADTAAGTGTPAMTAFWTSSNEALPDTMRAVCRSGSRPSRSAHQTSLSTAL